MKKILTLGGGGYLESKRSLKLVQALTDSRFFFELENDFFEIKIFNNSINNHSILQNMAKDEIGGRSVDITKEDGEVKIIFHPISKDAKFPNANSFTVKLSKKDLETIKKAF